MAGRAGTIFIVISENSPGFIWKLARRSGWAALFQAADVTALAEARSLIGVSDGRSEAGCAECDMCTTQRERETGIRVLDRFSVASTLCKKAAVYQTPGKFICVLIQVIAVYL